jgi:hypothetical protein
VQQTVLIAGDTLKYLDSFPDYLASAGYVLTTRLVRRDASGAAINFNATASGDNYQTNVAASTTAGWQAGFYTWAKYVTLAGDRYTLDAGELEIRADPATVDAPFDTRSHAAKTLAAIEAVIEGRATSAQQQWSLAGRQVQYIPLPELSQFRKQYRAEVVAEQNAERLAKGLKPRNRIAIRFTR